MKLIQYCSLFLASSIDTQIAFSAIWFREGENVEILPEGSIIDILGVPEVQVWQGQEKISLKVMDVVIVE